jgi:hypothetical protein
VAVIDGKRTNLSFIEGFFLLVAYSAFAVLLMPQTDVFVWFDSVSGFSFGVLAVLAVG